MKNARIEQLELAISPLVVSLKSHDLYRNLKRIDHVHLFTEGHVFAVWDFMSLLKSLQAKLTCISTPWIPNKNSELSRFINEIVHGEESDINELGEAKSHFEMYLDAMIEVGANTQPISSFIKQIENNIPVKLALNELDLDQRITNFVNYTFSLIDSEDACAIASAFTFGREDVIPDMFLKIIEDAEIEGTNCTKLKYYLERHIELDGDEHGPIALSMISKLCGNDSNKWDLAERIAVESLQKRIELWDAINDSILSFNQAGVKSSF